MKPARPMIPPLSRGTPPCQARVAAPVPAGLPGPPPAGFQPFPLRTRSSGLQGTDHGFGPHLGINGRRKAAGPGQPGGQALEKRQRHGAGRQVAALRKPESKGRTANCPSPRVPSIRSGILPGQTSAGPRPIPFLRAETSAARRFPRRWRSLRVSRPAKTGWSGIDHPNVLPGPAAGLEFHGRRAMPRPGKRRAGQITGLGGVPDQEQGRPSLIEPAQQALQGPCGPADRDSRKPRHRWRKWPRWSGRSPESPGPGRGKVRSTGPGPGPGNASRPARLPDRPDGPRHGPGAPTPPRAPPERKAAVIAGKGVAFLADNPAMQAHLRHGHRKGHLHLAPDRPGHGLGHRVGRPVSREKTCSSKAGQHRGRQE